MYDSPEKIEEPRLKLPQLREALEALELVLLEKEQARRLLYEEQARRLLYYELDAQSDKLIDQIELIDQLKGQEARLLNRIDILASIEVYLNRKSGNEKINSGESDVL